MYIKKGVDSWCQNGLVSAWSYQNCSRSYRGLHIGFDTNGLNSVIDLLTLAKDSNGDATRSITLTKPNQAMLRIPNINSEKNCWAKLKMTFSCEPDLSQISLVYHISIELVHNEISKFLDMCLKTDAQQEQSFFTTSNFKTTIWWPFDIKLSQR